MNPALARELDRWRAKLYVLAIVLAGVAVVRIIATYSALSQTWDEPAHIASGMEWLERGIYTYELQHPPLARLAVALGPYLHGLRSPGPDQLKLKGELVVVPVSGVGRMWRDGLFILHSRGQYMLNLALARIGVLPFFLLGAVVVWFWACKLFDRLTALVAVLLYTVSPNVLAHAGLATTDIGCAATMVATLYAFTLWLERPTAKRGLLLGLAGGLALITKFSAIVFLPACIAAIAILCWFMAGNGWRAQIRRGRRWWQSIAVASLVAFLICWAVYRFSVGPLTTPADRERAQLDRPDALAGVMHDLAYKVGELPIYPLTEMVRGIESVAQHNAEGHRSFLLGEVREDGWWYFFPVALAVKTPIAFIVLVGVGLVLLGRRAARERSWQFLVPPLCSLVVVLISIPSNINIGLRHILPVYPLLAIVAAYGAMSWLSSPTRRLKFAAAALILWLVVSSARAHPDYLAYFNEFAGRQPEKILISGDLDWGQDLHRLARTVDELDIPELAIAYNGSAYPAFHIPVPVRDLVPNQPTTGWVAISLWRLKGGPPPGIGLVDGFAWLEQYRPVVHVGKSIRLYHVPDSTRAQPKSARG